MSWQVSIYRPVPRCRHEAGSGHRREAGNGHRREAGNGHMTLRIRLFAAYREIAGADSLEIESAEAASVGEAWEVVLSRYPDLRRFPPSAAVNATFATPETTVKSGDEVAFLPPVSGG